jgi:uncharacterized protein YuzE
VKSRYLEVTYRRGRPLAAYLYLQRGPGDKSATVEQVEAGLLVDRNEAGRPLGVEITDPSLVTLEHLNRVLERLHESPLAAEDLKPLAAA